MSKLYLKGKISTNPETLEGYRQKIIQSYNKFAKLCDDNYDDKSVNDKQIIDEYYKYVVSKLAKCLDKLKCNYPTQFIQFQLIDESTIKFLDDAEDEDVLTDDENISDEEYEEFGF